MKLTIKKSDVIDALKKERLSPGYFIRAGGRASRDDHTANKNMCTVCAVGGVIRSKMIRTKRNTIGEIESICLKLLNEGTEWSDDPCSTDSLNKKNLENELIDGCYLNALSIVFEYECRKADIGIGVGDLVPMSVRKKLIAWTMKYMPDRFEVEV